MIQLKSIELNNFKGVSHLCCDFDDLTVLAGLNNSGKTSILQAVYLLFAALPRVAEHPHVSHDNVTVRTIALDNALSPLGLRDTTWLSSLFVPEVTGTILGRFENGISLELGIIRNASAQFTFTASHPDVAKNADDIRAFLAPLAGVSAAILTPPGDVPSREEMVNGDQYQSFLRDGRGAQLWRNGIWWAIQTDGFESFGPVQEQIGKYFPDIQLLLPTLGPRGTPEILIKYKEGRHGPLDIAQSGAGLRTFISLARILEQSPAKVVLLDEPDAHLHASQQAVILDLMLDAASTGQRQIIIASHSPEIISRVSSDCLRWVERGVPAAHSGSELEQILQRLGVTADVYIPRAHLPDVLVYVEGVDDRPVIEALIRWCRQRSQSALPSTLVVPHRDGRFESPTLQGIVRFARGLKHNVAVVGVRDLDWYYFELPNASPGIENGEGWALLTLPCKELENLFCDAAVLFEAFERRIPKETLQQVIDEESSSGELLNEWCFQVRPRVRDALPTRLDSSTKERRAEDEFNRWKADPDIRRRLVAGKALLGRIRQRVRRQHNLQFYPTRIFANLETLTEPFQTILTSVFPNCGVEKLCGAGSSASPTDAKG